MIIEFNNKFGTIISSLEFKKNDKHPICLIWENYFEDKIDDNINCSIVSNIENIILGPVWIHIAYELKMIIKNRLKGT